MEIITEADFRRSLKSELRGMYFFFGAEDYLKKNAVRAARQNVCPDPSLEFFNDIKISGSEFDPAAFLAALPTLPVMADKKLIEITGLDMAILKREYKTEAFFACLAEAKEYDFNVIIISVVAEGIEEGRLPKSPSAALKTVGEYATLVNFERSTPEQLSRWVGAHFAHNGIEAAPAMCAELIEFCGKDMFVLSNETDKLSWFLHSKNRTRLERADIGDISIADTGYDTYAFANALTSRRRADALLILAEMKRKRIRPEMILGEISATFCNMLMIRLLAADGLSPKDIGQKMGKMHEYKVKLLLAAAPPADRIRELIELCERADAGVKRSVVDAYMPIEQLICSLT
ncbi:MAG: DNA polymerase III subunit delta [Ruminococcaceae bacterium]|nr:DNA polymerase III subunit delta [Oscillospiraceae bacterium]